MSIYADVKNATVNSFKRNGKNLNARVTTFNSAGKDEKGKTKFKQVSLSVSVYDPDETVHLDKEDKISFNGVFNLDENPNVKMVHTKTGKEYKSQFPEVRVFADKVVIEGKGDRTTKKGDQQARDVETKKFPVTDHDDDDLFPF